MQDISCPLAFPLTPIPQLETADIGMKPGLVNWGRKDRNITLRNVEEAIHLPPSPSPFPLPVPYLQRPKVLPLSEVPTLDH